MGLSVLCRWGLPCLVLGLTACQSVTAEPPEPVTAPVTPTTVSSPAAAPEPPPARPTAYQEGIRLASSAYLLGQQATSIDDWQLVASRWQQALKSFEKVPESSANYAVARAKRGEYQRNLAYAQQRQAALQESMAPAPAARLSPGEAIPPANLATVHRTPIIRRLAGTPVIQVSVNGRAYPMILDTGASHTHIPRAMANELGLTPVGQATVSTASNQQLAVDVARVDSLEVAGIMHRNI